MTTSDTLEADLKAQAAAIVDEATAGTPIDDWDRRALVHFIESQSITAAQFMTGSPAEILAECGEVSRKLVAMSLASRRAA